MAMSTRRAMADTAGVAVILFLLLWSLFLLSCGVNPQGDPGTVWLVEDGPEVVEQELLAPFAPLPAAEILDPPPVAGPTLRVAPDPELLPAVALAAERFRARLGIDIEVAADGIPMTVEPLVYWRDTLVDGLASWGSYCAGYDCTAAHGVSIRIAAVMLSEKSWALQQVVEHELAHILSGWGYPAGHAMHLQPGEGLLSPGCVDHVCMPWSMADAGLICSGTPCSKIELN